MRLRGSSLYLRGVSLVFILLTAIVTVIQVVQYSISRANYPSDMTIGNVPAGGLDPQSAAQRLLQVYALPVELQYGDAIIDLDPSLIGFQLDTESMLAAADLQRTGASFWGGFWDYLWNRRSPTRQIPLVSSYSEARLRAYLHEEISARYDQPPTPAQPIPGTANFTPGTPGQTMDIDRAVALIDSALQSLDQRTVILASQSTAAGRPSLDTLQILLKQLIDQSRFDGLVDLYFLNLQTQENIHFAYQAGQELSITPDIAFTASSTIKIPILVSVYQHYGEKLNDQTANLIQNMITESENAAADALMASMDETRGPLVVTEIMQSLGLQNTFLAGYFAPGSLPLDHFRTPANSRSDINTDPDIYNQTTPSDMGMLLEDIYQCSQIGGGALVAVFPGQITQTACQQMLYYLEANKPVMIIKAGVPEGTVVANKYGYVADLNGIMNNVSDAAIVYSPAGNYVLTIYTYHPIQMLWNSVLPMFVELSRAIYNYYNLPSQ
ncbi:MAG: serine hydrolase [Chloroflexi bacterium]|nr:serine hydrolase [Chloroflexota bacterium]